MSVFPTKKSSQQLHSKPNYDKASKSKSSCPLLFDNLPDLIRPNAVALALGVSIKTIYDWKYQHRTKNIPPELFMKVNRLLYLRKDILRRWIFSQRPYTAEGEFL